MSITTKKITEADLLGGSDNSRLIIEQNGDLGRLDILPIITKTNDVYNKVFNVALNKCLLYYGYPVAITPSWLVDDAVAIYSKYQLVVLGDTYQNPTQEVYASTKAIIDKLKIVAPDTKIFGYVPIGCVEGSTDSNLTMAQVKARINQWRDLGIYGCFLDEFGYDYNVTRARQNEIVGYLHDIRMYAFVNSWSIKYIFSSQDIRLDWIPGFIPNPTHTLPVLTKNDYSLYENLFYSVEKDPITPTKYNLKCSDPWRIDDAYRYQNIVEAEYGVSFYEKFGTHMVCLDGIPSSLTDIAKQELMTISIIGAKILNLDYLAFGDERWGASGYFYDWDLPTALDLTDSGFHPVQIANKVGDVAGSTSFPYKWSANINGYNYSVVFDIPNTAHTEWVDGMRYATINGVKTKNIWISIFQFENEISTLQASLKDSIAAVNTAVAKVDAIMPTLEGTEARINAIVEQAKVTINEATTKLDKGLADLAVLSNGFNYKTKEW